MDDTMESDSTSNKIDIADDERGADGADVFVRGVAANIRLLRRHAGLTLAELASAAGIGRSTLAQLESGHANPSVETLWAVAAALEVPFARLVEEHSPALRVTRAADIAVVRSAETPGWAGRSLAFNSRRGTFEIYKLDLEPGTTRHADPHQPGVVEYVLVVAGRLRAGPQTDPVEISTGDLLTFAGDVPHLYEALEATQCLLVQSYP
jgi:transcriptional regulator with XRE-family HTH domain